MTTPVEDIKDPEMLDLGRILLLDDDEFDLMMYKRIIQKSGIIAETLTFTMAEDALAYLTDPETEQVDLILLDINMPRMNGFDFMEAACKLWGPDFSIPVVMMLTTSMSPKDRERADTFSPIKAFFNKPISADKLQEAAQLLGRA